MRQNPINRDIFEELFVLEMANNHWGKLTRGIQIAKDFGRVVRYNNMRAAIKLQFRDVDNFIHPDFKDREDIRYIKKTEQTKLSREDFVQLLQAIHRYGCMRMATPFDEASVDLCVDLDIEIIKIASSDINDWVLIDRIAHTGKPVVASTGGTSLKDMDDLVTYFNHRDIPLALNHCVALYPTEDGELELNQIDFLKNRYPGVTIGFSSHEHTDWRSSIFIAYAKGASTFERHIDIEADGIPVSPYCSTPIQIDTWFRAFKKAKEMCGAPGTQKRIPPEREIQYLNALVRGIYAAMDLPAGHILTGEDMTWSIPLQKGQLSCRELITDDRLVLPVLKGQPITINHLDNIYSANPELREMIENRGL